MKPLVRWTIGPVQNSGYDCLLQSILSFTKLYDVDVAICYNGHVLVHSPDSILLVDQSQYEGGLGVAWKLYPPRLAPDRHELFIDNDLIIENQIDEIDHFFRSDCTLLLECEARNYGRFENHVPKGYCINSGIFGLPPGFNLKKYIDFYGSDWEENCPHSSRTFDEQGLVATALLDYNHVIIPKTTITNCEMRLQPSKGMHFVGVNRRQRHYPYLQYRYRKQHL